eukprot:6176316-Pleurochrysis_carterae.AAC.1
MLESSFNGCARRTWLALHKTIATTGARHASARLQKRRDAPDRTGRKRTSRTKMRSRHVLWVRWLSTSTHRYVHVTFSGPHSTAYCRVYVPLHSLPPQSSSPPLAADYDSPLLAESIVTVGRRLGVLNIERHIEALDQADRVEVIRDVYNRIQAGVDQSSFFALKGWNYDRSSVRQKQARRERTCLKSGEEAT